MIKAIIIISLIFLSCGIAISEPITPNDDHYIILVLIWNNETGEPEENVAVTFNDKYTLYTADDGSITFDVINIDNIKHGDTVKVDCKYGSKDVPIIKYVYEYTYENRIVEQHKTIQWGTAVTFNEPDEYTVMKILASMGLIATSIGGGIYLLRKRTNKIIKYKSEDTKMEDKETWKFKKDFGIRAWIASIAMLGYITVAGIAVYQNNAEMIGIVAEIFMPIVLSIVVFYFGGAMVRDGTK